MREQEVNATQRQESGIRLISQRRETSSREGSETLRRACLCSDRRGVTQLFKDSSTPTTFVLNMNRGVTQFSTDPNGPMTGAPATTRLSKAIRPLGTYVVDFLRRTSVDTRLTIEQKSNGPSTIKRHTSQTVYIYIGAPGRRRGFNRSVAREDRLALSNRRLFGHNVGMLVIS